MSIDENFLQHAVDASLVDLLDENVLVSMRDGRKLFGKLSSFDQYNNIVVEQVFERILDCEHKQYSDKDLGLLCLRGENIALISQLSKDYHSSFNSEFSKVGKLSPTDLSGASLNDLV